MTDPKRTEVEKTEETTTTETTTEPQPEAEPVISHEVHTVEVTPPSRD